MKRSVILTSCLLACLMCSVNVLAYPVQENDTLKKSDWFDFWIGEWNLTWHYEDGRIGKGVNKIVKILDDKVIEERFEVVSDSSMEGFKGRSLSVFNPKTKKWHQAWADNQGGYFDFAGVKEGDKRIFKTGLMERSGQKVKFRMVFRDIRYDSFTWDWMISKDEGQSWDILWSIHYKRKE